MAELPNRDELEAQFAKRFGKVARAHLHEFRELLGNPPDIENVPEEFWKKMEKESEHSVYPILLLIFGDSSELHGWTGPDALLAAYGFAALRSAAFAEQWTDSTRRRLNDGFEKLQTQSVSRQNSPIGEEFDVHGETVEQHREANQTIPRRQNTHTGQHRPGAVNRTTSEPGEIDRDDLGHLLEQTFGPKRIERTAIIETTAARSAGGESAMEANGLMSENDIWCNPDDDATCEFCQPLIGEPRSIWIIAAPYGPPPEYSQCRCRCGISYEADRIADGMTTTPDWGPMEWARYWRNPESNRRKP